VKLRAYKEGEDKLRRQIVKGVEKTVKSKRKKRQEEV
jgi:hypothetical protein